MSREPGRTSIGTRLRCARFDGVLVQSEEEVMQFIRSMRPSQRMGTLDDVANAAEYLASNLADFISGQHLLVSGGAPA